MCAFTLLKIYHICFSHTKTYRGGGGGGGGGGGSCKTWVKSNS